MLYIASPDEVSRVVKADNLADALAHFMADRERSVSPRTFAVYRHNIAPFQQWWEGYPEVHGYTLSHDTFQQFVAWLESDYRTVTGNPPSPYTLRKTTVRVRHFLTWLHERGYVASAIAELCPLYHDPGRSKYYPDTSELAALLAAPEGPYRLRDVALIAFAIDTGARRFEIAEAQIQDLSFETPITNVSVRDNHAGYVFLRKVKGDRDGKNGLGRYSVFTTKCGLLLKVWLRTYGVTSGPIFGLGTEGVRSAVHNAAMRCNLPEVHPHAFRSAWIDYYAEQNMGKGLMADIVLKLQVGHAIDKSTATTYYVDTGNVTKTLRRIRSFYCSPLDEIDIDWEQYPVHLG